MSGYIAASYDRQAQELGIRIAAEKDDAAKAELIAQQKEAQRMCDYWAELSFTKTGEHYRGTC
jgi:hypothetical protein